MSYAVTPPPRTESPVSGGAVVVQAPRPFHLSPRERSKSSFMISGEGFSPSSCPHPESRALSCRLHDGIRSCPSHQTPSCAGVTSGGGFSLIELAIVLVILGLLVGGIMTGQSLIRAAELRSYYTNYEAYQSAVMNFQEKYASLPGDMPDATAYWGAINTTHATCIITPSPDGVKTCNGNGDGYINVTTNLSPDDYERFHFWVQLAAAGLVEGQYTGVPNVAGTFQTTPGVNVPKSNWLPVSLVYDYTSYAHPEIFPRKLNFAMMFEERATTFHTLTPQELWAMDTKIDDGKPATGKVFTYKATGTWAPNCATSATMTAEYNLAATGKLCAFVGALF
jgi:prepilin-type N-terminal cleavage/methylation domain-containing protein